MGGGEKGLLSEWMLGVSNDVKSVQDVLSELYHRFTISIITTGGLVCFLYNCV